jgi:hypothetical protein
MKVPDVDIKKPSGKIVVFSMPTPKPMIIIPASPDRSWMSRLGATDLGLPTSTANRTGWMVLNDQEVEVTWNGGKNRSDVRILCRTQGASSRVVSQFGNGIVTWKLPLRFRLPSEFGLRLRGPTNWPKEGVFPIEQVLDADSSPAPVSMSWRVTRIGIPVRFELGEPLCMIYPELQGLAAEVDPHIHTVEENSTSSKKADSVYEAETASRSSKGSIQQRYGREAHEASENASPARSDRESWAQGNEEAVGSHLQDSSVQEDHRLPLRIEDQSRECATPLGPARPAEPFYIENDFYDQASDLRSQFERVALAVSSMDPSANPFLYAHSEDAFQFITATAERIFAPDLLFSLLDRLRAWARQNLGVTHASTPQVKVYHGGSYRHFAKDDIRVSWHYLLSLTRDKKQAKRVKIFLESGSEGLGGPGFAVTKVTRFQLALNQLLVHDTRQAYGIDRDKGSTSPVAGTVLLDGYLW